MGEDASGTVARGGYVKPSTRAMAVALDSADELGGFRERFVIPNEVVYLDGNSLGCLPRATVARLNRVLERWGERAIGGWDEGWLGLPETVGDQIGALLGAAPGEVVVGDSTTVCLHKLASAALDARRGRDQILTDYGNFPTDRYVLEGLARARGCEIVWLRGDPGAGPEAGAVANLLSQRTALIAFSHVSYRSAHIADMAAITSLAHEVGALTLWDLSHSAGSVPVALEASGTDLAVGCTYKYLNGGPGAPAWLYVRRGLQSELHQPIWGWLGRREPFEMADGYEPAPGIRAFLSGTPPVLALAGVEEGVRLVAEAGIERIRGKAMALTELAIGLADERLSPLGVTVNSPRDPARRGAHVALAHPDARTLAGALIDRGVIVDFRRPDIIRLGLSPLTTRFVDVWDGVQTLHGLFNDGR